MKLINVKTIRVGNIIPNGLATVILGKLNKKITNINTKKLTKETLLIFLNFIIKNIPIIIEITHEKKSYCLNNINFFYRPDTHR